MTDQDGGSQLKWTQHDFCSLVWLRNENVLNILEGAVLVQNFRILTVMNVAKSGFYG